MTNWHFCGTNRSMQSLKADSKNDNYCVWYYSCNIDWRWNGWNADFNLAIQVNLKPYRVPFLILLAGGGITGIISILTYTITVMRKQQIIAILYGCVAVIAQVITGIMVKRYEITGATVTYTGAMLLLGIIFGALVWKWIRKSLKQRI